MAKDETRRIPPPQLAADQAAYAAVQAITNYKPARAEFDKTPLTTAYNAMVKAQATETEKEGAAAAARDAANAAEWAFHNSILGAKSQVTAQYGANSDEVQSLGLKKKVEYARPVRRPKQAAK
jgi:hypothetical protein